MKWDKEFIELLKQGYIPPQTNDGEHQRTHAITYIAFALGEIQRHLAKIAESES